jgi:hypothetical protein
MSDWYEALCDPKATAENAEVLANIGLNVLLENEIIDPELNSDCVLSGEGYSPGPAVPSLYIPGEREALFWELKTNGVEITTGRWFNLFGTTILESILCPRCKAEFRLEGDFGDRYAEQVGAWLNEAATFPVQCDSCHESSYVESWESKPHLGFSMLTFQFWNWPPLDYSGWKLDISNLIGEAIGHRLIRTWGRL